MLAQRTLKMPSETDKIYLHKEFIPLPRNAAKRSGTKIYKLCLTIAQYCETNG